ncbi:MAG TPA: extracellular solute-binding protein [Ktedonobacteraceae bacterium]|jgi:multiple sugar transport system substrate-binding protein|nr:extracellular solute-binding protein [Ktedonobacteraceae bacterium]
MRQWRHLAFSGLLLLSMLLTACGGSSANSAQQVVLKIADFSPEQKAFHEAVATEYHRLHPDVTIQWQSSAQAQYEQSLPLAFQSHQAPDIFYYKSGISPELSMSFLLKQGWIRPLDPDGNPSQSFLNRWPSGLFQEGINESKGKVYGFPFTDNIFWGPGFMFYNKSMFQQAGLNPANPPTTWNQFLSDCEAIKAKTGKYCLAISLKGSDLQRIWFPIAGSIMTDQFFDYKNGTFDLNNPLLLQAFSFIQTLYQKGLVAPGVNDKTFSRQQLASGQVAIYFDGTWLPSTLTQLGFSEDQYGIAAPPVPDKGPHGAEAILNTQNVYWASSQTKYPEQTWQFIQWITDPTGFFAKNYLKGAFGTLSFADNKSLITDPAMQAMEKIALNGLRVTYPESLLQCPDLAQSQAYSKAAAMNPNGEWQIMVNAIVKNTPLKPAADQLVAQRQQVFLSTLKQEAASGLKVSQSCYAFSNWNYNESYKGSYPAS